MDKKSGRNTNRKGSWVTRVLYLAVLAVIAVLAAPSVATADTGPCGAGSNPIVCENSLPGTPMNDWYAPGSWGDIQGFPTLTSLQAGQTISFKVSSPVTYKVEIFRLGWYGGDGAREMPTTPTAVFPAITQPACDTAASTGETDCGNWSVTATWTVPSDAVSGVYLADFDQTDGKGLMPYPFVVANYSSTSNIVVKTDDQTWQAYNMFGGADLYQGNGPAPDGRDYAVSYNRPMNIEGDNGVFGSEYPMIQFLERNGYDVSYLSSIDIANNPTLLENHKIYMSSGHDEYWDQANYNAVSTAKDAGVNLAFFSANEVFWRTELQPSIADGTAQRTLTSYKMTKMELAQPDGVADPSGQWTGTWMDPNGAGTGGNTPPNQLTGTLFEVDGYRSDAITVSYPYSQDRLWRNTSVAALTSGQTYTMQTGTLGYEWDADVNNAVRPSGEIDMSSTTVAVNNGTLLEDYGNTYGNGTETHNLVEYRDPKSGALVFGSGTVQWAWGLSPVHADLATTEDPVMEQATVNLFADMGNVQPLTLQSGLVLATPTAITTGPTVSVSTPAANITTPVMNPLTISGTATAASGAVVARVEISTNNGATWNAANGLGSWSYSWTPLATGSVQILVRAEDDSDNIGSTVTIPVTVGSAACPCSVFTATQVPAKADSADANAINVGMKFQVTTPGVIDGVQFYKAATNTGTHVGSLWTSTGTLLGSVTFTNETASGWQEANFSQPIPVNANTTYIVSYLAPSGHYSVDPNYFATQGAGQAPISGLSSTAGSGTNDVYKYAATTSFPTTSYQNSNYWVDAVFQNSTASTTPPTVTASSPASGQTGIALNAPVTASLSEGINAGTLKITVVDQKGLTAAGSSSYDPVGHTVTWQPTGELSTSDTYTVSLSATDLWGNVMPAPYTWKFTTSSSQPPVTCPCSLWNGNATPTTTNTNDARGVEVGTRFQSAIPGYITGASFYKGTKNTGTHVGNLWSNTGTLLATGTFTGESASGWQTLTFATPVAITANTSYVVSYFTPTGYYASNANYFTSGITNYPITGVASATGTNNGDGIYKYSTTSTFPTTAYNATNYWVDPIFNTQVSGSGIGSGSTGAAYDGESGTATMVTAANPVATTATTSSVENQMHPATVTFAQAIQPQSLHITVTTTQAVEGSETAANTKIVGSVEYNPNTLTASFTPDGQLAPGTTYKAVATAETANGTALPPITWTFEATAVHPASVPAGHPLNDGSLPPVIALAADSEWPQRTDPLPADV
ncbi:MAG TPA: DUF4082 domain-containing protein [Actinocrinis sp.]|nr:DUF4082 domain-containing protein [Actinocrinis sp.]